MKKAIDAMIPYAYAVLRKVRIANENNIVDKAWRGQISTFGSAVQNGGILAAVAFFSAQGGSDVKRERLMMAIWLMLHQGEQLNIPSFEPKSDSEQKAYNRASIKLFNDIKPPADDRTPHVDDRKLKRDIINAAVALKLAMNLYDLRKNTTGQSTGAGQSAGAGLPAGTGQSAGAGLPAGTGQSAGAGQSAGEVSAT